MGWREEYEQAIAKTEASSPVNAELADTCTKLADKIATLEAEKEASKTEVLSSIPAPTPSKAPLGIGYFSSSSPQIQPSTPPPKTDARLRAELAEALRAQTEAKIESRKAQAEIARLQELEARNSKKTRQLEQEKVFLAQRVKDQAEELKEKAKLLENVQDEMLTMTMELNVMRDQANKTSAENKELVSRWLKLKEQEVEKMNKTNEPKLSRQR